MPRAALIRSSIHPYHVTSRCLHQQFFPLPMEEVWKIMVQSLYQTHRDYGMAIHAFVLMGNHFHLLCHTPSAGLDQAMHVFLRMTSVHINARAKREPPLWDRRYRWSLIDSQTHYYQVYRYIFQNPLRANLVKKVEDYRFSNLISLVPFPIHSSLSIAFGGPEGEFKWLNEKFSKSDERVIKLGLKHALFDVNKKRLGSFMKLSVPKTN